MPTVDDAVKWASPFYQAGREAFRQGYPYTANPWYKPVTQQDLAQACVWFAGWRQAELDQLSIDPDDPYEPREVYG